jgi:hypothetical protein
MGDKHRYGDGVGVEASFSQAFFFYSFKGVIEVLVEIYGCGMEAELRRVKM